MALIRKGFSHLDMYEYTYFKVGGGKGKVIAKLKQKTFKK